MATIQPRRAAGGAKRRVVDEPLAGRRRVKPRGVDDDPGEERPVGGDFAATLADQHPPAIDNVAAAPGRRHRVGKDVGHAARPGERDVDGHHVERLGAEQVLAGGQQGGRVVGQEAGLLADRGQVGGRGDADRDGQVAGVVGRQTPHRFGVDKGSLVRTGRQQHLGAHWQGLVQFPQVESAIAASGPFEAGSAVNALGADHDLVGHHQRRQHADAEASEQAGRGQAERVALQRAADRGQEVGDIGRRQADAVVTEPQLRAVHAGRGNDDPSGVPTGVECMPGRYRVRRVLDQLTQVDRRGRVNGGRKQVNNTT